MLLRTGAVVAALLLSATACGQSSSSESTGSTGSLRVAAAFYPLEWVASQVAGPGVEVGSLTPPGAEPHDLELGPRDLVALGEADLVVYLSGFQPAVDDAVEQEAQDAALDVAPAARLVETEPADEHSEEPGEEHGDEEEHEEHGDEHADEHGHDGGTDPHFWLDPTRLADVADAVADRLADADPADAAGYRERAAEVRADLEQLDTEMTAGLADCARDDLVTSHLAFGYLADRYGFRQVGISGLTPEAEPSPQDVAAVADFVREHDVATIYYETLVSPDVARTIARETGAETAVLDPLEGLTDDSAGGDYLAVMRDNLQTLRRGQACG